MKKVMVINCVARKIHGCQNENKEGSLISIFTMELSHGNEEEEMLV